MNLEEQIALWRRREDYGSIARAVDALPVSRRTYSLALEGARAWMMLSRGPGDPQALARRALKLLDGVEQEGREDGAWWLCRGEALLGLKELKGARESLEQARSRLKNPARADALLARVQQVRQSPPDYSEAEKGVLMQFLRESLDRRIRLRSEEGLGSWCSLSRPGDMPGQLVVTLGLGALPMPVPEDLRGQVPARVELVARAASGESLERQTVSVLYRVFEGRRRRGQWVAPGMVVPLPQTGDFAAILVEPPAEGALGRGLTLPGGEQVAFCQALFLSEEEYRFCAGDRRVKEVYSRLQILDVSMDPRRPSLCPDIAPAPEEERALEALGRLTRQEKWGEAWQFLRDLPPRLKTRALNRKRSEILLRRGASVTYPARWYEMALQVLEESRVMDQADPRWALSMGTVLIQLGRQNEAVPFLTRVRGETEEGRQAARLLAACRSGEARSPAPPSPAGEPRRQAGPGALRIYSQREAEALKRHILQVFGEDARSDYHVTAGEKSLRIFLYHVPAGEKRPWNAVVTAGLGQVEFTDPELRQKQRVELVVTIPELWNVEANWGILPHATLIAHTLVQLATGARRGEAIRPGAWIALQTPQEGIPFTGAMVLPLPEELAGADPAALPGGGRVRFYRLLFLLPEETEAARRGEARTLREQLAGMPPGLELVRPLAPAGGGRRGDPET